MTAGDELLGEGLAGEDDSAAATVTARPRLSGIHFDGATRDFPLDEDGLEVAIHPVDSAMQLALMLAVKGIPSSPATGNDLRGGEYLDTTRLGSRVRDSVARATKALVDRGDVTIVNVSYDVQAANAGRLVVVAEYFNERLPDRQSKTVRATR